MYVETYFNCFQNTNEGHSLPRIKVKGGVKRHRFSLLLIWTLNTILIYCVLWPWACHSMHIPGTPCRTWSSPSTGWGPETECSLWGWWVGSSFTCWAIHLSVPRDFFFFLKRHKYHLCNFLNWFLSYFRKLGIAAHMGNIFPNKKTRCCV